MNEENHSDCGCDRYDEHCFRMGGEYTPGDTMHDKGVTGKGGASQYAPGQNQKKSTWRGIRAIAWRSHER